MKRKLFLIVLMLTMMGCSLFSGAARQEPVEKTEVSGGDAAVTVAVSTATQKPATPSETPLPPTEPPPPTEVPASPTPAGPFEYEETFDSANDLWSEPVIVTSQAVGKPLSKFELHEGKQVFNIKDKETYAYMFFLTPIAGGVSVDVDFESTGSLLNGIAIVCGADEEMTKWYEVRMSNDGVIQIMSYDEQLKTVQNKNPYVLLTRIPINNKILFPTKPNHVKMTCQDTEMQVDVNEGVKIITQPIDGPVAGRMIGIGAMSLSQVPVEIHFDEVVVKELE